MSNIENKKPLINQDFQQKISSSIVIIIELYKVIVSCMLILFVPQKCEDKMCSFQENLSSDNNFYTAGLIINIFTLFLFFILYSVEIKRENRLITYLEVNNNKPTDNDSVGKAIEILPIDKRNSIIQLDKIYQTIGKTSIVVFIGNTIISGIVIYNYYLDNQTTSVYATNILFMTTKIYDVYINSTSDTNIFYSAYLKSKVQYNDVDPDKKNDVKPDKNFVLEITNM